MKTELQIGLYPKMQAFWDDPALLKILQKGRQTGATISAIYYLINKAIHGEEGKVLWLDTSYQQIEAYDRIYWKPILDKIDKKYWKYNTKGNYLQLFDLSIFQKSHANPETIEGMPYNLIIVNECGHVLKNDILMQETIYPMILTTRGQVALIGTPKWLGESKPLSEYYYYQLVSGAPLNGWSVHKLTYKDNPYQFEDMQGLVISNQNSLAYSQDMLGEFVHGNETVNIWETPTILNELSEATHCVTDGQMMLTYRHRSGRIVICNVERWQPKGLKVRTSHHKQGQIQADEVIYIRKMPRLDLVIDQLNKCIKSKRIIFASENEHVFNYLNGVNDESDLTILSILLS